MPEALQKSSKCVIGVDYPFPIEIEKYTDPEKHKKTTKAAKGGKGKQTKLNLGNVEEKGKVFKPKAKK